MPLEIQPPDYHYCPFCGSELTIRQEEGQDRKYCVQDNWTYYPHVFGSAGAIIEKDRKVLLVRRNRQPYKDTWMFPAGFIEFGEHPEETVLREVPEETGYQVYNPRFFGVYQIEDDPRARGHFLFIYRVAIVGSQNKITDQEENSAIGWFSLDNLPEIGWRVHNKILQELRSER